MATGKAVGGQVKRAGKQARSRPLKGQFEHFVEHARAASDQNQADKSIQRPARQSPNAASATKIPRTMASPSVVKDSIT